MDYNHERRTNIAYVKTLDLQLNGNQINLAERQNSKDQLNLRKKVARSLRPCTLRRPMSATPSFGYRDVTRTKKIPPWSRPQSAGSLRRNKLAAKFSDSNLHDPDYCPDFGATYTLSSSQLLHSLMGSCSINEGLDSDTTPTPSPQPSLGDTIRAAAQLEPGLTAKPPLPPATTPQPRGETTPVPTDDIIALKFQRWFPDAILESEILKQTSLSMTPFDRQKDEADQSDAITNVDGAELTDKECTDRSTFSGNISTFVKKRRIPKSAREEVDKSCVKFEVDNKKSPEIVVHQSDPYGCDIVTEEFSCERSILCLAPDHVSTLKKSNEFLNGSKNKTLSLIDLSYAKPSSSSELRSHSAKVYSYTAREMYKNDSFNIFSTLSDSELYKEDGDDRAVRQSDSRNVIASPANCEISESNYRFTSTPIGTDTNKLSPNNSSKIKENTVSKGVNEDMNKESHKNNNYKSGESSYNQAIGNHNLSPPIRLGSEKEEMYNDHFNCCKESYEDQQTDIHTNLLDTVKDCGSKNKTKSHETLAHSTNEMMQCTQPSEDAGNKNKNLGNIDFDEWSRSYVPIGKMLSTLKERRDSQCSIKVNTKHGSLENMNKVTKAVRDVSRAASVPPYRSSKQSGSSLSKPMQSKGSQPLLEQSKRKVKRSMSYDTNSIPEALEKDSGVSSYEDIVTMIKVLEKEDLESPVIDYKASPPLDMAAEQTSSAKAILNFLDEVERGAVTAETEMSLSNAIEDNRIVGKEPPVSCRLSSLLNTDTAELAQQVMTKSLQLEDSQAVCHALEDRYKQSVELMKQQKRDSEENNKRHQKFIDQLLKEKRQLAVQYETAIREMETKHETAIKVIEERHKVEMKKAQDKFNAAEKIRRDKWIDTKTKKIKELTVRGLEPELERMAASHQEEIAELRRVHQRQLSEVEAGWLRRTEALREQEASERQAAVLHEREAARHRLEQEMSQVEKSYQEQRRRLLEEVRQEKELLQRQSERIIAEKQADIARQVDETKLKLQSKLSEYDKKHQDEIAKLRESLDVEKQAWVTRQKGVLEEKEAALREELKRERDRHIELVIRRLESEAAAKEQAIENKIKRLKESYDGEVNDLDSTLKELRARLKETRADLQKSEDNNATLIAQLSQAQNELLPVKQTMEKLQKDYNESMLRSESKISELQREITETKQSFQEQVNNVHNEKEKQLQQVYTRVKEAINKKEEALLLVTKQRDAALEQCNRLEKLLEVQRNHTLKL